MALELLLYTCVSRTSCKNAMATAPIRPKAYANWLTEVTATTPAPADARRHALCLFGQAAQLFTRWCPTVLAPELCNRQTFTQYDESVFESIAASTHLVVVRDCDVPAVWRDRSAIEDALRDVQVVTVPRAAAADEHALLVPRRTRWDDCRGLVLQLRGRGGSLQARGTC